MLYSEICSKMDCALCYCILSTQVQTAWSHLPKSPITWTSVFDIKQKCLELFLLNRFTFYLYLASNEYLHILNLILTRIKRFGKYLHISKNSIWQWLINDLAAGEELYSDEETRGFLLKLFLLSFFICELLNWSDLRVCSICPLTGFGRGRRSGSLARRR